MEPSVPCVPDQIPSALTALDQWVVWRYVIRDGKPTKIPFDARTHREASSTDPSTWSTFAEVVHALGEGSAYAGVGFVFSPDDPYSGIDLDDCIRDDGQLAPAAKSIVKAFSSYTEISPSGKGVKIFIQGRKPAWARCKSKVIKGFKETEIYDTARFFTVTGHRLTESPTGVELRQKELDKLCDWLWPQAALPARPPSPPPQTALVCDDQTLLTRMFASKHGGNIRRLWEGDTSAHGDDDSAADLAMCNHLAFWTGRDKERMDRLFRTSGLYRQKWERVDYRNWTLDKAVTDCRDVLGSHSSGGHPKPPGGAMRSPPVSDDIPTIHIDEKEHRVIDESIVALTSDPGLYQRGNVLVRVLREKHESDDVIRPEGSAIITQVPTANLRERLTRVAQFTKANKRGDIVPAHPTPWLVSAIDARGEWQGIRHLMGVSDAPILRSDGSVFQTPGYDTQTGVIYEPAPGPVFPQVHDQVNADDAEAACEALMEVVCDFRFEAEEHKSAWLAGLLTPLARFAFLGPTPLFLIDANIRGAGKGLLAQTIGQISLGREMPVSSYAHDSEEMRKKITSLAIAGDRMVLLDNLEGTFGNDALDRALTSTRWKDRILGKSEQVDLPLLPVWFGTGNNVQVAADTTRRIIHIRMDVLEERPEDRTDFKHPDLVAWVKQERGRLLSAALTILSAFIRAGRPKQNLTPFGSFEGWSALVRECIVWLGLPDPCLTRVRLIESADTTADALTQFMDAFKQYDPHNLGIVISEMLAKLYPADGQYQPRDDASVAMRAALENAIGCPPGKAPSNRQVGNRLKSFRRRVVDGRMLDTDGIKHMNGMRWRLFEASGVTTRGGAP